VKEIYERNKMNTPNEMKKGGGGFKLDKEIKKNETKRGEKKKCC